MNVGEPRFEVLAAREARDPGIAIWGEVAQVDEEDP